MKRLLLSLLFTIPFQVLIAQNVKVIPAAMNSSAKQEATDNYNPSAPTLKTDSVSESSEKYSDKKKNIKCVPGCSSKKQCVKKTSSAKNAPANTEEKPSEPTKR